MRTLSSDLLDTILHDEVWQSEMTRQVELEEKMRGMGIERFWANATKAAERGQETGTAPIKRVLHETIALIAQGIDEFMEAANNGKAGRKHTAVTYFNKIDSASLALLTSRTVLDCVTRGDTLTRMSTAVASMVEDELCYRNFQAKDGKKFKATLLREQKVNGSSYERQRRSIRHAMEVNGIELEEWSPKTKLLVGSKLIEIMVETTGLVQKEFRSNGLTNRAVYVTATPEAMEWILEESNRCALLSPVYLPTIIPPRPWTSPFEGGYWSDRVRKLTFIKTRSSSYLEELSNMDMTKVYDSVNSIQNTAWKINAKVLETVRDIWKNGSTLGDIPSADEIPLPTRPAFLEESRPKEEWTEAEMEEFKEWKGKAQDVHALNAKLKSLRLQFVKILTIAESFENEGEIYFPHQLDFRGRAYAVPMFLNPQGSDIAKGLLTFANAVPINDDDAVAWLAIHGSNSFGYDKDSMEGRIQWVADHEEAILASAVDPMNNRFWAEADSPFQFLAFCFEWLGFTEHGYGYESHLPVQMDGTCNGLQNFSACLRDPIGGAAVNLTPSDLPSDIYGKVADKVNERLLEIVANGEGREVELAAQWLKYGVDRKVCKRPVMTLAYGAKEFGFRQQVMDDTVGPAHFSADNPFDDRPWEAAMLMGKIIWESVGKVVVAAKEAMEWFQHAAKVAASDGLPVRWETPDGLMVLQAYTTPLTKRIPITFGGIRTELTVATGPSNKLNKKKQANSISPNWVHSMDASHMRLTVRKSWEEGIRSFALVHDSYGTHAGNAAALAYYLRSEFIEMYSDDVLEKFKDDLLMQLPEDTELPKLPRKGDLDLNLVMESQYFFA